MFSFQFPYCEIHFVCCNECTIQLTARGFILLVIFINKSLRAIVTHVWLMVNGYWLIQCSLTRFVCLEWFSVRPVTLVLNHPRTFSLDFLLTYLILFVGTHHAANMHSTGLIYSPSCKVFNDNMLIVVGLNFVKLHICPVETDTCAYISIAIS